MGKTFVSFSSEEPYVNDNCDPRVSGSSVVSYYRHPWKLALKCHKCDDILETDCGIILVQPVHLWQSTDFLNEQTYTRNKTFVDRQKYDNIIISSK